MSKKGTESLSDSHRRLHDAVTFGDETNSPIVQVTGRSFDDRRDITQAEVDGRGDLKVKFIDFNAEYTDESEDKEQDSPHQQAHVYVTTPQGRYYSGSVVRNLDGEEAADAQAEVSRKGYGRHSFTPEHEEKAAALITSLAAKRIGKEVMEHSDEVIRARNEYDKKYGANN